MTILNRDLLGRRIQLIVSLKLISDGYSVRDWFDQAFMRRGRGYWPRSGPWPIFYYWVLGPIDLRVWTQRAMDEKE